MVNYFKKVVLLKKAPKSSKDIKGLVIVESLNESTTLNFSFSRKIKSDYLIYVSGEKEIEVITLSNVDKLKITYENFSVSQGVTIAIFDCNELICFGEYGKSFYDLNGITNYAKKKFNKTEKEQNFTAENSTIDKIERETEYDDERIATENYYQVNDEPKNIRIEDASINETIKKAEKIEKNEAEFWEHEKNSRTVEGCDFYEKIKVKLDEIFNKFEECNDLAETLPNGKFIKIRYDENDFYYVGKVYENNTLKYLCYGVMGYQTDMPSEILQNFNFIPISNYELSGKGFYLLFQDAKTGEIIKKQD